MIDSVIVTQSAPHRLIVTLCGEIDLMLTTQLADANAVLARATPHAVHLDLQRVTFISAGAVGFLADLFGLIKRADAALTVAPIPDCVHRAIHAVEPDLMRHVDDGRAISDLRDSQYAAQGGIWEALTADFSAEERADLRQTVTRTARRHRSVTRPIDEPS